MSSVAQSGTVKVTMDRDERVKRFGIECIGPSGDGIFFRAGTWRPGGEYVQKLIIRNVSTTVKKLKYKLPSTRYFSMFYPEPIILSPGLSKEVDVVFRPVEYEPYDDTIYIKMLDGIEGNGFHIPVRATIDNLALRAPTGLDLNFCATHQITQLTFKLENIGEVDAPYRWESPAPFRLVPSEGIVPVGQYHEITLSIRPVDASVFVGRAICYVGEGIHAIIPDPIITTKLSAIGKFAYIHLSDAIVSWDEVVSGTTPDRKEIALINDSVVPAEFNLVRLDSDRDEVFSITPQSGVIPPRSEVPVFVEYKSLAMGCYSHDRYTYRTPGHCDTILNLRGMSMPPRVTLYKEVKASADNNATSTAVMSLAGSGSLNGEEGAPLFSFNFRDVELGLVSTRILFLKNDSPREVSYCVIADEHGAFQMHPKQGVIPPLTKAFPVTLLFAPQKPISYYRRFFILVEDAQPLFFDCLGTGFIRAKGEIKEQRPAPIRHAHVQAYRNRQGAGYGHLSPDELDELHDNHPDEAPESFFAQIGRQGTRALSITDVPRPVTRTGESVRTLVAPAHEFFISDADLTAKEVTSSKAQLNFGYTPIKSTSRPQIIVVTNNTHGKVVVQWLIPIVQGMETSQQKEGQDLRKSKDHEMITVDRAEKEFAALQAFSVTPSMAEINPGATMTFDISFVPKQSSRNFLSELEAYVYFKNQRTFRLVNDYSLTPPWLLTVSCVGHTFASGQLLAKAKCYGGSVFMNKLVFPCAFMGEAIYQTFRISNTSNLPCLFSLHLGWTQQLEGTASQGSINQKPVFSIKPDVGEIAAESFVLVCVRFQPNEIKKVTELLRLVINGDDGGKLVLEGSGAVPFLIIPDLLVNQAVVPEQIWGLPARPITNVPRGVLGELYMRPTSLGLTTQRTITLKNASRLPLRYRISYSCPEVDLVDEVLTITPMAGTLKGNDDVALQVTFAPRQAILYNFTLQVQVFPLGGKPKRVLDSNQPGPVDRPELLQSFSVRLQCQGEVGAVLFDPARTEVSVRLVHTSEERIVYLENISDAELQYALFYREVFEPDGVEGAEDLPRQESSIMRLVSISSSSNHQNVFHHSLFCEQSTGKIGARSRHRLVFTYKPSKSGWFEFSLFAKVKAAAAAAGDNQVGDESDLMVANEEAVVLRTMNGTSGLNDSFNQSLVDDIAALPLTATITARAAFPKLLFEDIRVENETQISTIDALWERFSFAKLNYDLSVPLTEKEIAINNSSSPDLKELVVYPFTFTPAVQHAPTQCLEIRLRNHGYLETAFRLSLPNEKQLELENWCDEDDPSESLNRLISIIEELRLFTIEPRQGRLGPGETVIVKISYKHSSLKYSGDHNLPVLVHIAQGKQFYLDLRGQTLAGNQATMNRKASVKIVDPRSAGSALISTPIVTPSVVSGRNTANRSNNDYATVATSKADAIPDIQLVLPAAHPETNTITLAPVPLGLSYNHTMHTGNVVLKGTMLDSAPMQRTELVNVSAYHLAYEVILGTPEESIVTSEEFIKRANHNLEVLTIANAKGTIASGASVFLEWYFYPLEERQYHLPFYIKYQVHIPPVVNNGNALWFEGLDAPLGNSNSGIITTGNNNNNQPKLTQSVAGNGSRAASRRTKGGLSRASNQFTAFAQNKEPEVVHIMTMTGAIRCVGYDPRLPKPRELEAKYIGGYPPMRPLLMHPTKPIVFAEDIVNFGIVPMRCESRRLLTIINMSSTQVFEFAFDLPSCQLSASEGLLTFTPATGRLQPQQMMLITAKLQALCQARILQSEFVKVIVREVVKAAPRSRGGTKQQLLSKIKARKTQSTVQHESVVSRLTIAQTMHVLGDLPDLNDEDDLDFDKPPTVNTMDSPRGANRPSAKFPTTINTKGELVTADPTKILRQTAAISGHTQGISAGLAAIDEEASFSAGGSGVLTAGDNVTYYGSNAPGSPSSRSSRTTPTAMSGGVSVMSRGSNAAPSTAGTARSTNTQGSSRGEKEVFGATYTQIIRFQGSIYHPQTIASLFHRDSKGSLRLYDEYPRSDEKGGDQPVFIPPVGQSFTDAAVQERLQAVREKAKVNVSIIAPIRNGELRDVCQTLFQSLSQSLLNHAFIHEQLSSTLSMTGDGHGKLGGVVSLQEKPQFSSWFIQQLPQQALPTTAGVYAEELKDELQVADDLIVTLKRMGHTSKHLTSFDSDEASNNVREEDQEERLLLVDRAKYALPWHELKAALLRDLLRFEEQLLAEMSPVSAAGRRKVQEEVLIYEASLTNTTASARTPAESSRPGYHQNNLLVVQQWVRTSLSVSAQRALKQVLREVKDEVAAEKLQEMKSEEEETESPTIISIAEQQPEESLSVLQQLVKSGELPAFQQAAAQAMDALCLQILRDTIGSL